jgi:nucleoside-diphosphate kinase
MAIEQTLVIIKPDGIKKSLVGNILTVLSETKLKIAGAKAVYVSREFAERHYHKLREEQLAKFKDNPQKAEQIYSGTIKYIMGEPFGENRVLAFVYHGENAIEKVRKICGATNPEDADPVSIRGKYGRINSKTGVWENVIHSSENTELAEREVKLWFTPEELVMKIYPFEKRSSSREELAWK